MSERSKYQIRLDAIVEGLRRDLAEAGAAGAQVAVTHCAVMGEDGRRTGAQEIHIRIAAPGALLDAQKCSLCADAAQRWQAAAQAREIIEKMEAGRIVALPAQGLEFIPPQAFITVWKDGTWKRWEEAAAVAAQNDPDWLATIPPDGPAPRLLAANILAPEASTRRTVNTLPAPGTPAFDRAAEVVADEAIEAPALPVPGRPKPTIDGRLVHLDGGERDPLCGVNVADLLPEAFAKTVYGVTCPECMARAGLHSVWHLPPGHVIEPTGPRPLSDGEIRLLAYLASIPDRAAVTGAVFDDPALTSCLVAWLAELFPVPDASLSGQVIGRIGVAITSKGRRRLAEATRKAAP